MTRNENESINLLIEHDCAFIRPSDIENVMIDDIFLERLIDILSRVGGVSKIFFDLREIEKLYGDVKDLLVVPTSTSLKSKLILVSSQEMYEEFSNNKEVFELSKIAIAKEGLKIKSKRISSEKFKSLSENLLHLEIAGGELVRNGFDLNSILKDIWEEDYIPDLKEDVEGLRGFLDDYSRNSLMGLLTIFLDDTVQFRVRPYHCHSYYDLELESDLLMTRPAILAHRTKSFLIDEILAFERKINNPNVKENELQKFFEQNPNLLRRVNQN